jgi:hypothetical protein
MVRIEPAGIRQHPHCRPPERVGLESDGCARPIERGAIGANPDYGNTPGAKPVDLPLEPPPTAAKLRVRELRSRRGGTGYQVGDADSLLEQKLLLRGVEQSPREAGAIQGGPESVAGPGKVMTGCRGVETGIDAAEENPQIGRNEIRYRAPVCCC